MLIRRQSARVKKSGHFSKIGGLLASVPSISRPSFRAACLRKIVWELFFRTGTLATQATTSLVKLIVSHILLGGGSFKECKYNTRTFHMFSNG